MPFLFGKELTWNLKCWISIGFGLILLAIGFMIDRKKKPDYAFWSYFFGTFSFWGGLNCLVWDKNELVLFLYFIINLLMMCLAVLLKRNILMIFGSLGVFGYFAHLAYEIFKDSIFFPFALSFIGIGLICLGILYQRNLNWIEKNIFDKLPSSIRGFLNN